MTSGPGPRRARMVAHPVMLRDCGTVMPQSKIYLATRRHRLAQPRLVGEGTGGRGQVHRSPQEVEEDTRDHPVGHAAPQRRTCGSPTPVSRVPDRPLGEFAPQPPMRVPSWATTEASCFSSFRRIAAMVRTTISGP
jgi:hypothetical protein